MEEYTCHSATQRRTQDNEVSHLQEDIRRLKDNGVVDIPTVYAGLNWFAALALFGLSGGTCPSHGIGPHRPHELYNCSYGDCRIAPIFPILHHLTTCLVRKGNLTGSISRNLQASLCQDAPDWLGPKVTCYSGIGHLYKACFTLRRGQVRVHKGSTP